MSKTLDLTRLSAVLFLLIAVAVLVGCPASDDAASKKAPATEGATTEEPTTETPIPEEPIPEEPIPGLPFPEEPTPEEPTFEEPTPGEAGPHLPVPQEPAPEMPTPEEPTPEMPTPEQPLPEQPTPEEPAPEQPLPEQPTPEEPAPEMPTPEEPAPEQPTPEEPTPEEPTPEEPIPEEPTPEEPTPEEPTPEEPIPEEPTPSEPTVERPKPLKKAELLVELPDEYNTPDGMCLLPDGNVIVSVPNLNDPSHPAVLIKLTPENKVEPFYTCPLHPATGKAFPFGLCVGPSGDLYLADLQWFADPENPGNNARVLRIPLKDGKPGEAVTAVEGLVVANAVIIRDGYLYVSDTTMVPKANPADPQISGIFRIKLDKEGTRLTLPLLEDPHLIATMKTYNPDVAFGADGLTFDSKGNLYCGNFADGTLHKIEFDVQGNPKVDPESKAAPMFVKSPLMKSCDGVFCDLRTDKIYVADSLANAVQVVSPDGSVETLAVDEENDGSGGRLDQPCEVLLRGNELLVSNLDFPVPGGVNTKFDKPHTMSLIKLD